MSDRAQARMDLERVRAFIATARSYARSMSNRDLSDEGAVAMDATLAIERTASAGGKPDLRLTLTHGVVRNGALQAAFGPVNGLVRAQIWKANSDVDWANDPQESEVVAFESEVPSPTIVCLCGSTRFKRDYERAMLFEGRAGRIVLSVACLMHADAVPITPEEKSRLDELHLRKIDLAHEILVIDVGGYVGDSTKREIEYARSKGKRIRWWSKESPFEPAWPETWPKPGERWRHTRSGGLYLVTGLARSKAMSLTPGTAITARLDVQYRLVEAGPGTKPPIEDEGTPFVPGWSRMLDVFISAFERVPDVPTSTTLAV